MNSTFRKLNFFTWMDIALTWSIVIGYISTDGRGSLFLTVVLSVLPIPLIVLAIYQYRQQQEESAGFNNLTVSDIKELRGTLVHGYLGIILSITIMVYGDTIYKMAALAVILITSRLHDLLYKCHKEAVCKA